MSIAYRDKVAGLFRASPGAWIGGILCDHRAPGAKSAC
jgi:hypothetical protein